MLSQLLSAPSLSTHDLSVPTLLCTLEPRGDSLLPELRHLRMVHQVSWALREAGLAKHGGALGLAQPCLVERAARGTALGAA